MGLGDGTRKSLGSPELTPAQQELQEAKAVVLDYHESLAQAFRDENGPRMGQVGNIHASLARHYAEDCVWHGVDPFNVQRGPEAVASVFYEPLLDAFKRLQRRVDVFLAGFNSTGGEIPVTPVEEAPGDSHEVWVCSMGHFLGLFDKSWLGIPPTGRLCFVRYCEFSQVDLVTGKITSMCLHVDVLGVMYQAGVYPLPPATGAVLACTPGPLTHDGILLEAQPALESKRTLELLERMCGGLAKCNEVARKSDNKDQGCPPELLAETWHEDMLWYGPAGIGATGLSIKRYQRQHQMPFRRNLYDKTFCGHVARFAEGSYEAWFGWPNQTNKASGGFLGLPSDGIGGEPAEWRVVDVYRRDGDKIAENWIFIDMLHYLKCRGLDVLARMHELRQLGDD